MLPLTLPQPLILPVSFSGKCVGSGVCSCVYTYSEKMGEQGTKGKKTNKKKQILNLIY